MIRQVLLAIGLFLSSSLFTIIITLGGFELYHIWKEGISRPSPTASLKLHPNFGWDVIPDVETLGGRTGDPSIVFLGDSFTQNAYWTQRAIAQLGESGLGLQGYSLGVSGYGTVQEYLKLRQHFEKLQPDIVVLLFFAWNDLRDNMPYPGIYYNLETRARPYLNITESQIRIQGFWSLPESILRSKIMEKLVFYTVDSVSSKVKTRYGFDYIAMEQLPLLTYYTDKASWLPFYRLEDQSTAYVSTAWKMTEQAMRLLREYVHEQGAELLVLGIDNAFSVDRDVLDEWVENDPTFQKELPLQRLGEVLSNLEIRYINGLPFLQKLAETNLGKVYDGPKGNLSGHLTQRGQEVLADLVVEAVPEML